MNYQKSGAGPCTDEEFTLFFYDRSQPQPIVIESIGITHPNPKYRMHRDKNQLFVLEYVRSGKGYLEQDGKLFSVAQGDVYCLEPGFEHSYYADKEHPFEKIWINFFSDLFVEVFQAFALSGKTVFHAKECAPYFEELLALRQVSNYSDELCLDVCGVLFRIVLRLSGLQQDHAPSRASDLALSVKNLLDGALYGNITVEQIAEELHFSKAQIIREFQRHFSTTPYRYLLNIKIEMAKKLLLYSGLSVQEIGTRLAFTEAHYFSRIFKKKTGMSPIEFKARRAPGDGTE